MRVYFRRNRRNANELVKEARVGIIKLEGVERTVNLLAEIKCYGCRTLTENLEKNKKREKEREDRKELE